MIEAPETDDHADMLDAVRSAMETHSEAESSHQPVEHEQLHEGADHARAATEMGLQVAALMNQEERQRGDQSKQQRDARGRFSSATSTDVNVAGSVHETAGALHVPEAPAAAPNKPPSSWSPEAKADWPNLSPAVQQAALKREDEVSRGFQDYRGRSQQHAEIENVIAPRRQRLAQFGFGSDAQAINHLLTISDGFSSNPIGTLQFLAQQAGIGPEQLFPGMHSGQQVEALIAQRVQMALAQAEVQRFEQKAPEFYGLVRSRMGELLQSGAAATMADAYKQAIAQHPAVQSIEQQRQVRERRERQIRAANASLNGAPHGVSATPPRSNGRSSNGKFGDIADDVRAAMASLS
jgi:hypothetical protein